MSALKLLVSLLCLLPVLAACTDPPRPATAAPYLSQLDDLSALWSHYKFAFIENGRVVELDEHQISTSEGQSYALLRAVWSNDRPTFDQVWDWTRLHLQVRGDRLFAWKWQDGKVADANSATDADVDIALALLLASRRFGADVYLEAARPIIRDIALVDVAHAGERYVLTSGNWTANDAYPQVHVGYHAPYAYEEFAKVDATIPWGDLVRSTYDLLHWLYFDVKVRLPPEFVFVERRTGRFLLAHPATHQSADFSYDAFPLFWRIALDHEWQGRREGPLRAAMLAFFTEEWASKGRFFDRYTVAGEPRSAVEAPPLYATVDALARSEKRPLAGELSRQKLQPLWTAGLAGQLLPYYLQNWLWFDRASELAMTRDFDEVLGFLRPFDAEGFWRHFPAFLLAAALLLFPLARFHRFLKLAFLLTAMALSVRYLGWRLVSSLNFAEPTGPVISLTLWVAEAYGLATVLLLWLQVGLTPKAPGLPPESPGFAPPVDIMIPIYSESLEILEATLVGATNLAYAAKTVYVCDDSHRADVAELAAAFGAVYVRGPKRHAKAGNLNHALTLSTGELVVVFDTDHIPVSSFLAETVPYFAEPRLGVLQTPHVFYNDDIFQRALGPSPRVGNEQDMFNHGIQAGRAGWGGAFFVGSGALFRRTAIAEVGGFNLLSITEDIHTSQLLHAKGWTSAFVDKNLAVGLAAESLSGFIVQRRRWMLGCLQIFFRDNPLLLRGLPLRHRLGYAASLSYFFFPAARVIFWVTPIYYLVFHWHPLLAEVAVLLAYLVPFVIVRPLMTAALLPGWPRIFWGQIYEGVCSFALFRAMFDLLLPKRLGFKVTPKGVTSSQRRFDAGSAAATLVAVSISVFAIAKGALEFSYFGIEKEAYFFNLSWAALNLVFLLVALLIAWERPQRRHEERVARRTPLRLTGAGLDAALMSVDISLSGLAAESEETLALAPHVPVMLTLAAADGPLELRAIPVYQEAGRGGQVKLAFRFEAEGTAQRRRLVKELFTRPDPWADRHTQRTRSTPRLAWLFVRGLVRTVTPLRPARRLAPRHKLVRRLTLVAGAGAHRVLQRDHSASGTAVLVWRLKVPPTQPLLLLTAAEGPRWAQVVYAKTVLPGVSRWGLQFIPAPAASPADFMYITE